MGKFSRSKGARNERLLVEHLKRLGYSALRVPLSGAMAGFKHDVTAVKDGVEYTFELKVRANEYASIYHYFKVNAKDGVVRIATEDSNTLLMSDDFEKVKDPAGVYQFDESRTAKKLFGMNKLRQGAQFLVIRGDRVGFLFLSYGVQ